MVWLGFGVTRRLWVATFVGLMVASGPLWGALTVSFMTDVPAFAVSMLGVRARSARDQTPTGLVALSVREHARRTSSASRSASTRRFRRSRIALVAGSMLWRERSRPRLRAFLVASVVILVGAAVFWAYWRTIPHPKAFSPELPSGHSVRATLYKGTGLVRLVGLLTFPAVVAARPVRIVRRSWAVARDTTVFVAAGTVAILWFTASSSPSIGFAGNYITPDGILAQGVAFGHRPAILPAGVFNLLLGIGTTGAVFLAIAIVPLLHLSAERLRTRDLVPHDPVVGFLGLVVAGYAARISLASVAGIPLYDRYVLPVVPLVAVLLLRPIPEPEPAPRAAGAERRRRALGARSGVALVVLAFIGYVYTADSAAFDGARWNVAVKATELGWDRHQIRGGFEWANFYAGTHVPQKLPYCVQVVINPPQGLRLPRVIAYGYYRSPLESPVLVVAQRTRLPCLPAWRVAAKP